MAKVWKIDKPCMDCGVMMYAVYPGQRYCEKCRKARFLKKEWKVFTKNGKEIFAYTVYGEGEDEQEATIALLAYENHCRKTSIHVHTEWR